jgi:hypothetical protein
MMRPQDLIQTGLSHATIYRRAGALGFTKPYKFTPADVKRIMDFKKKKKGKVKV